MKRLLIAAALGALVISGAAVSAQAGDDACMQKGGTLTDKKCMLTMDIKVSVDYPLDLTAKNDLVATTVDAAIASAKNDFMQTVGTDFIPAPGPYELDITYDTVTHSDTVYTLLLTVYQFTGGAHGGQETLTYTFDTQNNKILTLDDVFKNTTDALKVIEPIAQAAITKNVGDMNQQDMLDAGTAPTADNYQFFSLDKDGITFYFQQYQVAPYAAGIQTVTIPFTQLSSVLKPGIAS